MYIFLFFSFLCIKWTINTKIPSVKQGIFTVPLRYDEYSPINLTLPVVFANFNATKAPILFFGPGNGNGNIPDTFEFVDENFPDNPVIFIGYRGIESDPSPNDKEFRSLTRVELKNANDRFLSKIINKTFANEKFQLSDFWITNRAQDVIHFLTLERQTLDYFHIIAVGEDGSRIAHQVAATLGNRNNSDSKRLVRIVMVGPSVLSWPVPHNDTTTRLLAVIRSRCRRNHTCPYKNVRWIPPMDKIPKHPYGVFNVQRDRIEFIISHQLRIPSMIPNALDVLQSITDGSSFGYIALSGFTGPENMPLKWYDVALHVCAKPFDKSLYYLPSFELICPYLPPIEYFGFHNESIKDSKFSENTNANTNITQPMLLITGEFDLPRPKTVIDFYKNVSTIPSLVDNIILNLTSSRFDLLRPDVLNAVLNYLNYGNTTFVIDPPQLPFKAWKTKFGSTKMIKFTIFSGMAISVVAAIFVYYKSNKEDMANGKNRKVDPAKEKAREKWLKEQEKQNTKQKKN